MIETKIVIDKKKGIKDIIELHNKLYDIIMMKDHLDKVRSFQEDNSVRFCDMYNQSYNDETLVEAANNIIISYVTDGKQEETEETEDDDLYI